MKGIAVLGLGRSGTAYLMEVLQQCGCHLGQVNWALENHEVRRVNDDIFKYERGADMSSLPYGRIAPIHVPQQYYADARGVIEELEQGRRDARAKFWAFKDPRTTLLMELWEEHVDVWVGIFRDPARVVASYIDQGFINCKDDRGMMIAYWKEFNGALLELYEKQPKPTYLLHFDRTINRQIEELVGILGLPYRSELHFQRRETKSENFRPIEDPEVHRFYRKLKRCTLGKKRDDQRLSATTGTRGARSRPQRV